MADNTTNAGWRPEMNPAEHIGTYDAFLTGAKVGGTIVVLILVGMATFLL